MCIATVSSIMICVNEGLNGLYYGNERNDLQKGGICPNLGNIPEDMSSGKCHHLL